MPHLRRTVSLLAAVAFPALNACTPKDSAQSAALATSSQKVSLQGFDVQLEAPSTAKPSVHDNKATWLVSGVDAKVDVTRIISLNFDDAIARIKKFFGDEQFLVDERTPGHYKVVHRSSDGVTTAHHIVELGPETLECMATEKVEPAHANDARAFVEKVCNSLVVTRETGIAVHLDSAGDATEKRVITPARAEEGAVTKLFLTIEQKEAYKNEEKTLVATAIFEGKPTRSAAGVSYEFHATESKAAMGPCTTDCRVTTAVDRRALTFIFSENGQLQIAPFLRPDEKVMVGFASALGWSTASFPADAVGKGASWSAIEPRDEKVPRGEGKSALTTHYALVDLAATSKKIERKFEDGDAKNGVKFVSTNTFESEALPAAAEGKLTTVNDVGGAPMNITLEWHLSRQPLPLPAMLVEKSVKPTAKH